MTCGKFEVRNGDGLENIQAHLPQGYAWLGFRIIGKRWYQFISAIGMGFDDMSRALCRLILELSPFTTEELLPSWERAVGLPDSCFPSGQTLEARRFAVQEKLARRRYTTIDTWRELAARMGIAAKITPGDFIYHNHHYDYEYPVIYGGWKAGGRFRVYIEADECASAGYDYTYPFAYELQGPKCQQFKCVIERIRPSCVIVIWGPPPEPVNYDAPSADQTDLTFDNTEVTI